MMNSKLLPNAKEIIVRNICKNINPNNTKDIGDFLSATPGPAAKRQAAL